MKTKTVNRTIHPLTHKSENAYRVKIGLLNYYQQLIVNIKHEDYGPLATYVFNGRQIAGYESIHFKAAETNNKVVINWVQNLEFKKTDHA